MITTESNVIINENGLWSVYSGRWVRDFFFSLSSSFQQNFDNRYSGTGIDVWEISGFGTGGLTDSCQEL